MQHGSGGRPHAAMPIPGARQGSVPEDWAVTVGTALTDTASYGGGHSTSLQEGLFGSSLRARAHSDGYGSFGHGHGAWLSSSPHPAARHPAHRGGVFRSPSLQRQVGGRFCVTTLMLSAVCWHGSPVGLPGV